MKITTQEMQAEQARRLATKTQDQRMVNEVTTGTGMSPWEAQVVIEVIREVYFATPGNALLRHGQLLYTCVKVEAGAGVALKECPMTSVTLSILGEGDEQVHGAEMLRRHRVGRLCEEARDQGGLLTQEDLAQILSCDARTIRRDIKVLKALGIHICHDGFLRFRLSGFGLIHMCAVPSQRAEFRPQYPIPLPGNRPGSQLVQSRES